MDEKVLINRIKIKQVEDNNSMKSNNVIKTNIINLAEKKKIKHNQIAKHLNMQPSNFSRALKSDSTNFTDEQLNEIAKFLNVNAKLFLNDFTYVKIVAQKLHTKKGIAGHNIEWFYPYDEYEYLQCSPAIKEFIEQGYNDTEEAKLGAIKIAQNIKWNLDNPNLFFEGNSVNNQYWIIDSNRRTVKEDCHGYMCIISAQRDNNVNETFVAEVTLKDDYVICEPYYPKYPEYKIPKDKINLCSPIFFRTMHKNIVKKSKEIWDKLDFS